MRDVLGVFLSQFLLQLFFFDLLGYLLNNDLCTYLHTTSYSETLLAVLAKKCLTEMGLVATLTM